MVKTLPSKAGGVGLIPGWEANIPHASWPKNQNIRQKQYCTNLRFYNSESHSVGVAFNPRPEYWSGQPFPSPRDLPNPGTDPSPLPALQADSLPAEPPRKPRFQQWTISKKPLKKKKTLHQQKDRLAVVSDDG